MKNANRYDTYAVIHKGLRLAMSRCLIALSSVDPADDDELAPVMADVAKLLDLCRHHVKHENTFIHTAMERRQAGSTRGIAHEHDHHLQTIAALESDMERILHLPTLRRSEPLAAFYSAMAIFIQENFAHMAKEESDNNAVLWRWYSDEEIINIEKELVASIDPTTMQICLGYMAEAMNPQQRGEFFSAMRQDMPEDIFTGIIADIEALLSPGHRSKLRQALNLPCSNAA